VVRVIGYEQLPTNPPLAPITAKLRTESKRGPFAVRRHLAQLGYQETINFSFVEERWERELAGHADPIRLLNPIASQMSVMRSSLLGSLIAVLKFNLDRKAQRVRLFELGRVFLKAPSVKDSDSTVAGFDQPMRVSGLAYGSVDSLQWGSVERGVDFFDLKGDVQALLAPLQASFKPAEHPAMHPGRCASVWLGERCIGHVGELHPKWRQAYDLAQAPVMFELALDAVLQRDVPVFQTVSRHQPVERDIAIVVKESVTHAAVMDAIRAAGNPLLRDTVLFDVYRPKKLSDGSLSGGVLADEKSLAVRLTLSRDDATLTEEEIETAVRTAVDSLMQRVAARLR
jgi:phenylalanyl-tRNA synthetase beta chain